MMDPIRLMWVGAITFWSAFLVGVISVLVTYWKCNSLKIHPSHGILTDRKFMESFGRGFAVYLVAVVVAILGAGALMSGFIWFVIERLSSK